MKGGCITISKQAKEWPPLDVPEFHLHFNQKPNRRKSIFVADDGKIFMDDAFAIAKDLAQKMGMGDKQFIGILDASYSAREKGWNIIVQSRF